MTIDRRATTSQKSHHRHNFAAAMIAGAAAGVLYYSFEPATAEERAMPEVVHVARLQETPQVNTSEELVPNPQTIEDLTTDNSTSSPQQVDPNLVSLTSMISQLQSGIERLEQIPKYSFQFTRQERIDGELKDEQTMQVKLRHAPFSVYMKWLNGDKGRELLYTANENDGRMLVKLGGLKGRFIPALKIDPNGAQAKAESRHPITRAGLVNLAKEIIKNRQSDIDLNRLPACTVVQNEMFDDRPCTRFTIEYSNPADSPVYRKVVMLLDQELSLPVYVRNHTWPTDTMVNPEEESLISCYTFQRIQPETELAEATWEKSNPKYRFR